MRLIVALIGGDSGDHAARRFVFVLNLWKINLSEKEFGLIVGHASNLTHLRAHWRYSPGADGRKLAARQERNVSSAKGVAAAQGLPANVIRYGIGVVTSVAAIRVHFWMHTKIANHRDASSSPAS